jgi:hypothetical protein
VEDGDFEGKSEAVSLGVDLALLETLLEKDGEELGDRVRLVEGETEGVVARERVESFDEPTVTDARRLVEATSEPEVSAEGVEEREMERDLREEIDQLFSPERD